MQVDTLIVPRGAEARAVLRGWPLPHPRVVRVPAGAAAATALPRLPRDSTALVLGVCGALDPALRVGDPVVYGTLFEPNEPLALDLELTARCAALCGCAPSVGLTVDRFIADRREKSALRAATHAAAVDMEGAPLARALAEQGVRVAMVRIVSDAADGALPDLGDVYDARGALRLLALALALARAPRRSLAFVVHALRALRALRAAAARLGTRSRPQR